ncbi:MAG: Hdr-like menaquinol oxidoreductase cytochrome c subunit [Gammaproteobacteria bacterium]|nr:Hdr-like menaquinol oxidoreductase cytochrome c subunit [Gammaproteobacteria bacterium]MDH3749792.1 Hdr-like menaquinol oxidoreductase cytochrome c subunit [Gammaproteobacteria bacterium]
MAVRHSSIAAVALVLVLLVVALAGVNDVLEAAEDEGVAKGVPMPVIPRGQGDSCVYDTEFMRRNHMTVLKHQHDEPDLKDIRSEGHSIKDCVACHAVMGPDARPLTADSPEHFCRSCHDYAAVKIDCFDCHKSRPRRSAMKRPREPT